MKAVIRIYYHNSLSLHVKQEGFIIPFSLVLHVLGQEEGFIYAFSYLALVAFPPRPNPIDHGKEDPMTLTQESPRSRGEFSELGATKVWPAPLKCFRLALVSQAGVVAIAAVGAA